MANSQLVLAAHYLAGLETHRSLSSRGAQEGPGGVCSGKEVPYVTVGLDWKLDQLPMPPTLKYKSRSISASLESYLCLNQGRLQWVKTQSEQPLLGSSCLENTQLNLED